MAMPGTSIHASHGELRDRSRDESPDGSPDLLMAERRLIERRGRLSGFHWLVLALSAMLTLFAWHYARSAHEERVALRFEGYAEQALGLFTDKLHTHADLLRASAGFLAASEKVTVEEWRHYTDSLSLESQFPAINGFGVIYRVPRESAAGFLDEQRKMLPGFNLRPVHVEPLHLPLSLVAPRRLEARLLGFDLAHDPLRREAIMTAMRRGEVRITAPVGLDSGEGTGFVMFAPFRDNAELTRRGGVTAASMAAAELAHGTLAPELRKVAIRIRDGDTVLHDEHRDLPLATGVESYRSLSRQVPLYGRVWDFDIRATPVFDDASANAVPTLILVGGIVLEGLLLLMFVVLLRANRHSLSFAERLAERLRVKQVELEASNEELESFARIASHDLKSPLNSIRGLTELIDEDLADYRECAEARQSVHESIELLKQQASRGRSLVDGVLEYSRVGEVVTSLEVVDLDELIGDVTRGLGIDAGRLIVTVETPLVETHRTRLAQVLTNLVGNAVKYHHEPDRLRIEVDARMQGPERCRVRVADNGPGIDERHHERAFELFGTLDGKSGVDSTGVGLSIVKKMVERLGGRIELRSGTGRGATFEFDWPARPVPIVTDSKAA